MKKWIVLAFLCVAGIINFSDKAISGLAAVPIMEEFDISYAEWGIVGSSFYWLFAVGAVLGSAWSDRVGTKMVLAVMAIVWSIAQVGGLVVSGLAGLVLIRVLLGLGEGPFFSVAVNHISKWFPPESRGLATSLLSVGNKFGISLTAPFLVVIIASYGWRIAFSFLGITSLIWLVLWVWLTKEKPDKQLVQKIASSDAPIPKRREVKWSEINSVLLSPTYIFSCLISFMNYWFLVFSITFIPMYLVQVKGFSQTQMAAIIASAGLITGILVIALSLFSDRLFAKYRNNRKSRVSIAGIGMIFAGFFAYSLTSIHSITGLVIVIGSMGACYTIPASLAPHTINTIIPERAGLLVGLALGFATLAGMIGPAIIGKIVDSSNGNIAGGFEQALLLCAILAWIFGVLYLVFTKPDELMNKINNSLKKAEEVK